MLTMSTLYIFAYVNLYVLGNYWKRHRKIITPAFHSVILETFIDIYYTQTLKLVEKLKKELGKLSFDVHPYVTLCSLDIICGLYSTAFHETFLLLICLFEF